MADIWLPNFARVPLGSGVRGKPYQYTHNPKGCLHTTEGGSIAGARAAYAPYPPHLIYDWRTRQGEQHVPLNLAAYSAMDGNDDDYMVQVELVGFARETRNWSDEALRNVAQDVIAPLEKVFGIPRNIIYKGFKDERDGITLASPSSPVRISAAELRDFSGWLGHQHLPAPDEHWDPGALPLSRIFSFLSEEDDLSAEAERQIGVIHDFLAVSAKAPNKQTLHDVGWANQRAIEQGFAATLAAVSAIAKNSGVTPEQLRSDIKAAVSEVNLKFLYDLESIVRESLGHDNAEQADMVVDELTKRLNAGNTPPNGGL